MNKYKPYKMNIVCSDKFTGIEYIQGVIRETLDLDKNYPISYNDYDIKGHIIYVRLKDSYAIIKIDENQGIGLLYRGQDYVPCQIVEREKLTNFVSYCKKYSKNDSLYFDYLEQIIDLDN